jgi:hypothetical protein
MDSSAPSTTVRPLRLAGPLALAAAAATILLAGLAIAVLAAAELRVRSAVDQQRALDAAVQEASAAAGAVAVQGAAWKSYLLATSWRDERGAVRAKSALATATAELSERLDQVVALGSSAALPIDGASRAVLSAMRAKALLVESLADARGADAAALAAADQALLPAMEQARHELFAISGQWTALARARRIEATTMAADSARRMKAWIEILSLVAVALVIAVGAIAVRRERMHVRG